MCFEKPLFGGFSKHMWLLRVCGMSLLRVSAECLLGVSAECLLGVSAECLLGVCRVRNFRIGWRG